MDLDFEFETRFGIFTVTMSSLYQGCNIEARLVDRGRRRILETTRPAPYQQILPFAAWQERRGWFNTALEILHEIYPDLECFTHNQEKLIEFCVLGGHYAVDLLQSNPSLAFYISLRMNYCSTPKEREENIMRLVRLKRVEIVSEISIYSARWVVKLYNKIPSKECSYVVFQQLHNIIEQQMRQEAEVLGCCFHDQEDRKQLLTIVANRRKIKTLRHLPQINRFVLEIMKNADFDGLFESSFFHDVCSLSVEKVPEIAFNLRELHRLMHAPRVYPGYVREVIRLRFLGDIDRYHDRFVEELAAGPIPVEILNGKPLCGSHIIRFPSPPLPDLGFHRDGKDWGISAITDSKMLWEEGVRMQHCIASYYADIKMSNGHRYVYHIKIPDENPATLLIGKRSDNIYRIIEMRGVKNQDVGDAVTEFVQRWLKIGPLMDKFLRRVSGRDIS